MKTKVQLLREERNLTQSELAEKSGLSLRTIQRIEAGNIPKGFTRNTLANFFETEPENLIAHSDEKDSIERAKLINISVLTYLLIPFGNLILPTILTYKSTDERARELGKEIINIQIIYTFTLGILLIVSPFIQRALFIKFPLFIIILITMKCLNLLIIFKNGASLTQRRQLAIKLKTSIL